MLFIWFIITWLVSLCQSNNYKLNPKIMTKTTQIERAGKTCFVNTPGYWFDECGQICIKRYGTLQIGCPNCAATFAETCYCGFVKQTDPSDEDGYDQMYASAFAWNAEHNPSANW